MTSIIPLKSKLLTLAIVGSVLCASGQKPMTAPHVLIVPDLIYCKAHGFTREFNNGDITETIPDYEKALSEDPTLHSAVTQIASLINDRDKGFVILDLQEVINLTKTDATFSNANGGDMSESIEEAIIRNSNADILVKLQYDLMKNGPQYQVSYTLRGTDAYSGQMIAPLEGIGSPSTAANPAVMLRESIYSALDPFLNKLLAHYTKMLTDGRMVTFDFKITNTSPHRMNSRFGDLTLQEHIDDTLYDNSVDGAGLERVKGGDTFLTYSGVYIPLTATVRGRQRRQGAKDVAQKVVSYLETLGIAADYKISGLGKVNVFIR